MFKTMTVCVASLVLGVLSCGKEKMADAKTGVTRADIIATHYEPDASIFPNPERGFYIYTNLHKLDPAIGKRRDEGHTLLRGRIFMEDYREVPFLPESFLAAVEKTGSPSPGTRE